MGRIGAITQLLNELIGEELYVHTKSRRDEFVGRVDCGRDEFERFLEILDFEQNPYQDVKHRILSCGYEGSWRRPIDEDEQLHVVFYDGTDIRFAEDYDVFIYAHTEPRWDEHPIAQYRGKQMDAKRGVQMMRKDLDEYGMQYDFIQP